MTATTLGAATEPAPKPEDRPKITLTGGPPPGAAELTAKDVHAWFGSRLVLALVGFAWARARWSPAGAWIAGAPCVLAALWLASSIGSRLLPGLV